MSRTLGKRKFVSKLRDKHGDAYRLYIWDSWDQQGFRDNFQRTKDKLIYKDIDTELKHYNRKNNEND